MVSDNDDDDVDVDENIIKYIKPVSVYKGLEARSKYNVCILFCVSQFGDVLIVVNFFIKHFLLFLAQNHFNLLTCANIFSSFLCIN